MVKTTLTIDADTYNEAVKHGADVGRGFSQEVVFRLRESYDETKAAHDAELESTLEAAKAMTKLGMISTARRLKIPLDQFLHHREARLSAIFAVQKFLWGQRDIAELRSEIDMVLPKLRDN
jgi:hypothetical protein